MNFYDVTDVNRAKLQQGDVVWPVTFGGFKLRDLVATQTEDQSAGHKDFDIELSVSCITSVGIVLNQACDLTGVPGREKPIVVLACFLGKSEFEKFPLNLVTWLTRSRRFQIQVRHPI